MHWRSLPGDLVEDILSRVSAIPLVRLRETSKQWNTKLKITFFTAMAYCYAPQRTRDSWFGIHVQGKPSGFLADEQNQVVVFLNTKSILHVMRQNKHILEKHLGGKSSVLLNYVPSLAQIQEATLPGGRKRKAPST
ncbi:BnaA01g24120D [Brassica napus]|uniref:BnaA01g24120D protein n=1 Tax=Brassica napus TaxID=3708 RepID=A0A078HAP3_BRANA|nr:BnaA01g24120D [Brassica napus]